MKKLKEFRTKKTAEIQEKQQKLPHERLKDAWLIELFIEML